MFLCAEQPRWKANAYERGIWRAEICNEKVCSLSLSWFFFYTFLNGQSRFFFIKLIYWTICIVLFWKPTLYVFCRPNSYVSGSVTQQKKTTDGGTRKRYFLFIFYGALTNFNRLFINGVYACLLGAFFFELAGIMIYTGCFSCQMDFQMGLNWLTMSKDRYWNIFVLMICSCNGGYLMLVTYNWSADVFYSRLPVTENFRWLQAGKWYCLWLLWQRGMIIEFYRPHQISKSASHACLRVSPPHPSLSFSLSLSLSLSHTLSRLTILSLVLVNRLALHSLKHMLEWLPGVNRE